MPILLLVLALVLPARAQLNAEWTAYTSMRTIKSLLVRGNEVWAITSGGVLRFDQESGRYDRFTRLDGLAGNKISSLEADERGHLWFGTEHQGLSRFRPETGRFDAPYLDFLELRINALAAHQDRLYVGTERGVSVFLIDKEEVRENYRQLGNLPKDTEVTALAVHQGFLWAGTVDGLARADLSLPNLKDPDSWSVARQPGLIRDLLVFADTLYATSGRGVWRLEVGVERPTIEFTNSDITSLGTFSGRAVGATADGAFYERVGPSNWRRLANVRPMRGVTDISRRGQALWVATAAGLQVVGGTPPPPPREPAGNRFYDMALDARGHLWVASVPKDNIAAFGIYQFDGEGWIVYDTSKGLPMDFIANVETDSRGLIWAGTWGRGVAVLDSAGAWQFLNQGNSVLRGCCGDPFFVAIGDIARDAAGRMWISNVLAGLAVFDGFPPARSFLYEQSVLGIDRDIDNLAFAPDGLLWISTPRDGFLLFDDGGTPFAGGDDVSVHINSTSEPRLASDRMSDILVDRSGQVWAATDNGLNAVRGTYSRSSARFQVQNWKVYNANNGLPSNEIKALAEDGTGHIWVGTEAGLARISPQGAVEFSLTTANSGLIDNRINSLLFDPATSELWIGTLDGLSRLKVSQGGQGSDSQPPIFPNPFQPGRGAGLTFTGLPLGASLQIFTLAGERVRSLEGTPGRGTVVWDGQNEAGFLVGSGIYYFVASDPSGQTARGKFAVVNQR